MQWAELESHFPSVFRFALRLTGDTFAAEDLTQETLLRAWQKRSQVRQPGSIKVWLLTIAKNLWRDQTRRRIRSDVRTESELQAESTELQPAEAAMQREVMAIVEQAMTKLPDRGFAFVAAAREKMGQADGRRTAVSQRSSERVWSGVTYTDCRSSFVGIRCHFRRD